MELMDFAELPEKGQNPGKAGSCTPAKPHLYNEHDTYGME